MLQNFKFLIFGRELDIIISSLIMLSNIGFLIKKEHSNVPVSKIFCLPDDVLLHSMAPYFDFDSYLALGFTCKPIFNLLMNRDTTKALGELVKAHLKHLLNPYPINLEQLDIILSKGKAVLGGSFLLAALTMKNTTPFFEPKDLDIFVTFEGYNVVRDELIEAGCSLSSSMYDEYENPSSSNGAQFREVSWFKRANGQDSNDDSNAINVICVEQHRERLTGPRELATVVNEMIDLSMLANSYTYSESSGPSLCISRPWDLYHQVWTENHHHYPEPNRVYKYQSRGFVSNKNGLQTFPEYDRYVPRSDRWGQGGPEPEPEPEPGPGPEPGPEHDQHQDLQDNNSPEDSHLDNAFLSWSYSNGFPA